MGNDLSEKISSILSDEESLKELKELADMLTTAAENENNPQNNDAECFDENYSDKKQDANLSDLSGLLSNFKNENSTENVSDNFDFGEIIKLIPIIQGVSENDKNRNFLLALRPLLSSDKQKRLDKAVKLLKIYAVYKAVKESGINLLQ